MPSASIGLYLGAGNAELVVLGGSGKNPRLIGSASIPFKGAFGLSERPQSAPPVPEEGASPAIRPRGQDEKDNVDQLQELLAKIKLPNNKVHVSVASEAIVIRYFQMPQLPPAERKMAVTFEAKKYLPFKLEDLVSDYQVVTSKTDPTVMRVMFYGIRKGIAHSYVQMLESAKLAPQSLEAMPVSLMRLLRQAQIAPADKAVAAVFVEPGAASITVFRDNLLYLSRNVTILSEPEETPAAPETPQPTTEGPLSPELIEALLNEARVSLDYYRRRFLGEPQVAKMVLLGKGVTPALAEQLSNSMDVPVEIGEPFQKITGIQNLSSHFAPAVGLALRGLERREDDITLLPPEVRPVQRDLLKLALVEGGIALLLLVLLGSLTSADIRSWEDKIRGEQQGQRLPPGVTRQMDAASLQRVRQEQQQRLQFVKAIAEPSGKTSTLLQEMTRLLPEEGWLQELHLEDTFLPPLDPDDLEANRKQLIRLNGSSYSGNRDRELEGINSFVASLRKSPEFGLFYSVFNLDSALRKEFIYPDLEVTQFSVSGASELDDLREAQRSGPIRRSGSRRRR
ncbi:MAG: hypothetical protein COV76_05625 [Candidatus Omnitrophica bacterium CG11_big_fil_rev_8_21_14_0_20_64_10]|nr:MAG: hypothetical protein COV76_05625 [Candidatus Omnitrophica bacterium CG11_big_fil_rev_8_21_14_0_20_64_10]